MKIMGEFRGVYEVIISIYLEIIWNYIKFMLLSKYDFYWRIE